MHIILTGATGKIGSHILLFLLSTPSISKISILSRREIDLARLVSFASNITGVGDDGGYTMAGGSKGMEIDTSKVDIILHTDYTQYGPELIGRLRGAEACVWAQGVSRADVGSEECASS
jgi:hypothetical protein